MEKLIGGIFFSLIISGAVAFLAKPKAVGYLGGFVINMAISFLFMVFEIPFDILVAGIVSAILFMLLPFKMKPVQAAAVQHTAPAQPVQSNSIAEEIEKLNKLREAGALSEEEFAQAKARLLT